MIVNEPRLYANRTSNLDFANNEQSSLAVSTAAFCFANDKHNLIKLELLNK